MQKLPTDVIRAHKGLSFPGITTVFYCHDGHGNLLLGKRSQNARDEKGRWDPGGGGLKHGWTVEDNMLREIKEEYDADSLGHEFIGYFDALRPNDDGEQTHWLAMCFAIKVDRSKVKNCEPDMLDEIGWFSLDSLPTPMHSQFPNFLKKNGDKLKEILKRRS